MKKMFEPRPKNNGDNSTRDLESQVFDDVELLDPEFDEITQDVKDEWSKVQSRWS